MVVVVVVVVEPLGLAVVLVANHWTSSGFCCNKRFMRVLACALSTQASVGFSELSTSTKQVAITRVRKFFCETIFDELKLSVFVLLSSRLTLVITFTVKLIEMIIGKSNELKDDNRLN